MEKITYPVNFDPPEYEKLRELAREQDRSMAWIIRHAVRQYLDLPTKRFGKMKLKIKSAEGGNP